MKLIYIIIAMLWSSAAFAQTTATLIYEDFTSSPLTTPYPYKVNFAGNLSLNTDMSSVSQGLDGRYLTQTGNGSSSSTINTEVDASDYKNIEIIWYDREIVGSAAKRITRSFSYAIGDGSYEELTPFTSTVESTTWRKNTVVLPPGANNKENIRLQWRIIRQYGNTNYLEFDALKVTGITSLVSVSPVTLYLESVPGVDSKHKPYEVSISKNVTSAVNVTAPEHFKISRVEDDPESYKDTLVINQALSSITIFVKYFRPDVPEEPTEKTYSQRAKDYLSEEHYGDIIHTSGNIETLLAVVGMDPTPASSLPVELATFQGEELYGATKLAWATASEKNNEKFIIERSQDGRSFTQIGQVLGSGNTVTKRNYSFTDNAPSGGTNYYRLRQIDFDGKESFSNVIALVVAGNFEATVYPSVASKAVTISLQNITDNASVSVTDITGRTIASFTGALEREIELPVHSFRNGVYFVRISNGKNQQIQRFIKE